VELSDAYQQIHSCDLRREEVEVGELIDRAINEDGRFVWCNMICVSLAAAMRNTKSQGTEAAIS
jgi:hypothetical protein